MSEGIINHGLMLGLLNDPHKAKAMIILRKTILPRVSSPPFSDIIRFGPFNSNTQRRWKKPVDSAQTRLENRTRDLRLDKLMKQYKKLKLIRRLHELMLKWSGHYTSVQLISKWRNIIGINVGIGEFLRKYPHIFELYKHPVKRNICCVITQKMADLIEEETKVIEECESDAVWRLKKLLMMSTNGTLHIHALWLIRRELGLPDDFRDTILQRYPGDFRVIHPGTLALVSADESLAEAEVEKWRKREYEEKWLSEFETKYAFPIQFPTGFKIEKGFRERMRNWQRLPYLKPYEKKEIIRVRTCGGTERFEKRAVGILHEFMSLMVEKMVELERLSHFRRDFSMEVNVRELILKHPGIFYISTKGNTQTVFLREAYTKGCLVEPNPIYAVRRKMLDLVLLGCWNTNQKSPLEELKERSDNFVSNELICGKCDGDWVLPILESCEERPLYVKMNSTSDSSEEEKEQ